MKHRAPTPPRVNVADAYATGRNSLNLIRLVLAAMVIVSHAWPVNGHGEDPTVFGVSLGTWAVAGFFGISGYLIAVSREHHGPVAYLTRRVLRIYPGFWACLIVTAFVFAPIAAAVSHDGYAMADGLRYLRYTFTLRMHNYNVGHTLASAPYPHAWDGSLWTLRYEFLCYLVIGALLTLPRSGKVLAVWALFIVASAHNWIDNDHLSGFVALFAAGSIVAMHRRWLPMTWMLAIPAAALAIGSAIGGRFEAVGGLGVAYALLWLGASLPARGFGQRNDLSYGMYIYGFPMAQLLNLAHLYKLPVGFAAAITVAATVPVAALSWVLVERPAQRLAKPIDRVVGRLAGFLRRSVARRPTAPNSPQLARSAAVAPATGVATTDGAAARVES